MSFFLYILGGFVLTWQAGSPGKNLTPSSGFRRLTGQVFPLPDRCTGIPYHVSGAMLERVPWATMNKQGTLAASRFLLGVRGINVETLAELLFKPRHIPPQD